MLFKIKTSLVLTVLMTLFGCAFASPLAVAQCTTQSTADKTEAEKAAAVKADIEKYPLVVIGVEPYVADKGVLGTRGCPAIPGTPAIPAKPATPGTPATADKPAIPETPATPAKPATPGTPAVPGTAGTPGKAGMGDRIAVVIDDRFSDAVKYKLVDPTQLILFVDGRVFKDVHPESVGWNRVVFKLERTTAAIDAWNGLLGSPGLDPLKLVKVSIGFAEQQPWNLAFNQPNLNLIVYRKRWAVASLIILILMLLVLWKKGKDMLRDSGPPEPKYEDGEDAEKPYSLAKVQVAWWFTLVVGCFLLIYLITGEYTMTEQALILIGIGTGTALGSAMIDSSKRSNSDTELETLRPRMAKLKAVIDQLREHKAALEKAIEARKDADKDPEKALLNTDKESLKAQNVELIGKEAEQAEVLAKIEDAKSAQSRPISEGIWKDLVTDANGPSFHRFQMIAWTVILGALFLADVYKNLSMPEFSGTMLALMGISAGTYLGFKIPEKQNTAEEIEKAKAAEKAKEEAEAKAKADAEAIAKADADAKAREEADAIAKEEADAIAKEEADAIAKEETDAITKEEADAIAKEEVAVKENAETDELTGENESTDEPPKPDPS